MPDAHGTQPQDPQAALGDAVAAGATIALLGDRDPVPLVRAAAEAAGRPFEHVDARGLVTLTFDRLVRGGFDAGAWTDGALSRALQSGGVFLLAHGEALLDDLRQRMGRMLLTRRVAVQGPSPTDDRLIDASPGTALVLHVDDHRPVLLQVHALVRRLPVQIRCDVAGPPPVARR